MVLAIKNKTLYLLCFTLNQV